MDLSEYFELVQEKIKNNDFIIFEINNRPKGEIYLFLESINYMMYEWCDDHKDQRTHIFDYILIPNDIDFDFKSISFKDFLLFLTKEKSKKIELIYIN